MYIEMSSRVMLLVWRMTGAVTRRMSRDERGEIGSWMIFAAGLAVAAAAAIAILGPWFSTKATNITNS